MFEITYFKSNLSISRIDLILGVVTFEKIFKFCTCHLYLFIYPIPSLLVLDVIVSFIK